MRDFVRALIVGPDGKPDEQALISIVAAVVFFVLVIFTVIWLKHEFDMQQFGIGLAGIGAHRLTSAIGNAKETSASTSSQ